MNAGADRLFALAQEAYCKSTLPEHPNYKEAEGMLIQMMNDFLAGGR